MGGRGKKKTRQLERERRSLERKPGRSGTDGERADPGTLAGAATSPQTERICNPSACVLQLSCH